MSSNQQPVIDAHPGMGSGIGHVPGLAPEQKQIKKSSINSKLSSASDQWIM